MTSLSKGCNHKLSPKNRKLISEFDQYAIGIVRRSDIKQTQNASLETQSDEIRIRARKEGYEVLKIYTDDANSAYHKVVTRRLAMQELLEAVLNEENNISAVFFYEESRVSRQFYDFTLFVHDVIKKERQDVKFFSTCREGEWDPYDILSVINFATAADLSVKKSRRAKDSQKNSLNKEIRPGSDVPFGYKLFFAEDDDESNKKHIKGVQVIDSNQASIVLFIFYLASWGHSQQTIADFLNGAKISSPNGKTWSSGTIDYILDNDQYLGHLPWNIRSSRNTSRKKKRGEYDLLPNHHESIVNVLLWNLTHQTIGLHKQSGSNNKSQFFLRGLLYCHKCKEILVSKNETPKASKKEYLVYRCKLCKQKIDLKEVHEEVINELSSKWYMLLNEIERNAVAILTKRKKKIVKHRDSLLQYEKNINLKENSLLTAPDKVNHNNNWDFILSISKTKLKRDIFKANSFIEHIELLNDKFQAKEMFSLIKISKLQNPEIRTLLLILFKRILVDFENGKLLYVDYKLAPFSEIEQYIDSI